MFWYFQLKIKIKIEISYLWFKKIYTFQYLKEITTNAEPIKPTYPVYSSLLFVVTVSLAFELQAKKTYILSKNQLPYTTTTKHKQLA